MYEGQRERERESNDHTQACCFHFFAMRRHRLTAQQALERLNELSFDESDGGSSIEDEDVISSRIDSESEDDDSSNDSDGNDNRANDLKSKDGTVWSPIQASSSIGRRQQQNVRRIPAGVTTYAKRRITDQCSSCFDLLFSPHMQNHIRTCTEYHARHIDGNTEWTISVEELRAFIGLCYARGVLANGE